MASSSSSHQHNVEDLAFSVIEPDTKRRKVSESSRLFDVFINHRGPDSKETLAVHLYNSLQELGLQAFLDCKEKENGEYFPSTIETAIRSASVHIAIFSERYAESAWCLAELVLMLESRAKIFPLFYGVKPSELRHIESGAYADAFTKYKEKGRYLQKLASWNTALQSASLIAGLEIDSAESFCNSGCFKNFVLNVQKEVERTKPLYVAQHPVALHKLVKDFESQCLDKVVHDFENQCGLNRKGKNHSKIVGIFGMGGAGKTTLAKELFNRKRSNYTATCFLFDVRETSSRFGLPSLQVKLIKGLFHENPTEIESREEGCNYIRDRLGRSGALSFLIVADDVDDVKQLDTLCLMDVANNSQNSLIIVTTRDVGVLTSSGISNRYNLKGLNRDDGRELFCWHSFGQRNPASGYENLIDAFLDVCGGLPLSLQILGRHVYDRPVYYWELQLCKVRESLHRDIRGILKISFDALDSVEKQIFMDIACFFVDKCKNTAIRVWEGSAWEGSGWRARYAVETLKDRCLVEETESLDGLLWEEKPVVLKMHDHLRDLGREISKELNSPPRHWCPKHRKSLETKGFQDILAQTKGRCFDSIYDRSMGSQITYFMGESEECGEASSSLLWLQLDLYCREFSSIPPWIPLQNLQCLRISHGSLKRLWQSNVQAPSQLKELQMYQTTLEEFPDFSGIPNNLEQVVLDAKDMPIESWSLLESLRIYPRSLVLACSTLHGELACNNRGDETAFKSSCSTSLVIRNFVKLTDEMALNNIGESTSLKYPLSNLEHLEINNQMYVTNILICGNYCPSLSSLKIHDMEKLNSLEISTCKRLVKLDIFHCSVLESCSVNVSSLEEVRVGGCEELKCLELKGCKKSEMVEMFNLEKIVTLIICDCPELQEFMIPEGPNCLERITIRSCQILKKVSGNINAAKLLISDCPELEELPCFAGLTCLKEISIFSCGKLQDIILPTALNRLHLNDCRMLKSISGISHLRNLVKLNISQCWKLELELRLEGFKFLERFIIDRCQLLKTGISHLRNLVELNISQCWELELRLEGMKFLERLKIDRCQHLKRVSGDFDPVKLHTMECPELEELPYSARLTRLEYICIFSCGKLQNIHVEDCEKLEKIDIKYCEKMKSITLPSELINLSVKGCRELQRVVGISDLTELRGMSLSECPELEKLPNLSKMRCLKEIKIDSCGKLEFEELHLRGMQFLERITLDRNIKVKYFELDSCQNLKTVMFGCENLKELRIQGCPKLEKLPAFKCAVCLERVIIDGCGNFNCLELDGCQNLRSVSGNFELTKLYINQCPELEELANLSSMRLLEEIHIKHCKKMKNITLPTTLISLSIRNCRDLQRISVTGDFMEITKTLSIRNCAMLEELPMLATQRYTEEIKISDCDKLQNITLPSRLIRLYVGNCRDLQTISVTGDFVEIKKLFFIRDCAMLQVLPMIDARSCVEGIFIDGCEKLENITGIKELRGLILMRLRYCSNALILYYIHELKNVPSAMEMIARAADEAESSLNEDLFYDANIGVDGVVEIAAHTTYPKWSELSALIFCFVVVFDTSTSVRIGEWVEARGLKWLKVREGKWIITLVAFDDIRYDFLQEIIDAVLEYGIIKKGFRVEVKPGKVWKSLGVEKTIVDKLHHS